MPNCLFVVVNVNALLRQQQQQQLLVVVVYPSYYLFIYLFARQRYPRQLLQNDQILNLTTPWCAPFKLPPVKSNKDTYLLLNMGIKIKIPD